METFASAVIYNQACNLTFSDTNCKSFLIFLYFLINLTPNLKDFTYMTVRAFQKFDAHSRRY